MSLQRISTIAFTPALIPDDTLCVEPDCASHAQALVASPSGLVWPVCWEAADYATWSASGLLELPGASADSWQHLLAAYQDAVKAGLPV